MRELGRVCQSANSIVGVDFEYSVGLVVHNSNASTRVRDEDYGVHIDSAQSSMLSQT